MTDKPFSYFGFDDWLTDIPPDVDGPTAGIAEYVDLLTAHGVEPMSIVQALSLVLGQQISVLVEGAAHRPTATGQVLAESMAVASLESTKYSDSLPEQRLH